MVERNGLTLRDAEVHPEENAIIRHFEPLHTFEMEMDMRPVRLRILYAIGHGTHEDEGKHGRDATMTKRSVCPSRESSTGIKFTR